MKRSKYTRLFCFSPPVMLATFFIEILLAIYLLARYKFTRLKGLAAIMLAFLATFQLAEFFICGENTGDPSVWARVGYVTIAILPPIGLHIVHLVAKKPQRLLVALAYTSSVLFIVIFGLLNTAFIGQVCGGNYVVFELMYPLGTIFFVYYFAWLLTTMYLAAKWAENATKRIKRALLAHIIGYIAFIIPAGIINVIWPASADGLPSIMCGFAVVFAVLLVAVIVPADSANKQ